MILEQVFHALQTHAAGSRDASGPGLADVLWRNRDEVDAADLQVVWLDLAQLLQALLPEVSLWQGRGVPLECSYSVAEIVARATKLGVTAPDEETRHQGALLGWRVATAWEALMAGDIDDLLEHVSAEEWALRLRSG